MSLTVLVVAGFPALLVFSFALISDSRSALIGVAVAAVGLGLFTGSAAFAVLDTFCVLVGFLLGLAQQNRRHALNRQSDSASDQRVTRHNASTASTGASFQKISPVGSGSTAASGARAEPKLPKAIWHDTPEEEKAELEKEFKEWLAHKNRKE